MKKKNLRQILIPAFIITADRYFYSDIAGTSEKKHP